MVTLHGYKINELIYQGTHSTLYRGIREIDNTKVIVKILNSEYPTLEELANIKREYRITNKPYGQNVIKSYGIEDYKNSICIIIEDFSAISLTEYLNTKKVSLGEKLTIALGIAKAIRDVHKQGVIHKDVNPHNIVINPDSGKLKLIDFGISTDLNSEKIHYMDSLEGTCLYIAPEQTGKINRILDQRSDLYSVGITYYELFVGKHPFYGDDLEVIHSHIAKIPVAPNVANNEVPRIISDIIMKLIAKNAEDRYQTAMGLIYDMEYYINNLHSKKELTAFKIAQNDVSNTFQIPQKLYGRNKEINLLKDLINGIDKNIKLILVSGYSGIGKTSIIHEIVQDVIDKGGKFVSGKFDQFERNTPYSALIYAFRKLIKNLLTDVKNLKYWQNKIKTALGKNAKIITDLIPELEQIIGKQPDVIKLNPNEEKARFYLVFRNFINAFANKENPLVLFFDDVQWSDLSTIGLIKNLLMSPDVCNIYIIAAYRDNEVSDKHPLIASLDESIKLIGHSDFLHTIYLGPLKEEDVNQLIADTLKRDNNGTKILTGYIYQKTKGNPFFTNQLLKSLSENGTFKFNEETLIWEWDIEQIEKAQISDNVIGFLIQNLCLFPERSLNILKLASCIGNYFDLKTLYLLNDNVGNVSSALWKALKRQYIVPLDNNYPLILNMPKDNYLHSNIDIRFKFSHDRIQQAINSLIPENEQKLIHYKIGKILLESAKKNQFTVNIFEMINHLNIARTIINDKDEKFELLQLNNTAGIMAKSNTAYDFAKNCFQIGKNLLSEEEWLEFKDTLFDISFNYAETTLLAGNVGETLNLCNDLSTLAVNNTDIARISFLKTTIYELKGEKTELILDELRETLKLFGIYLPTDQEDIERMISEKVTKVQEILAKNTPDELARKLPIMENKDQITSMNLLFHALPPAYQGNPPLFMLIQMIMFEMAVNYGATNASCKNFAEFGTVLISISNDLDTSYQFGKASFTLADRLKAEEMRAAIYFIFATFISHWKSHYSESIEYYNLAIKHGLEVGDIIHSTYSAVHKLNLLISAGLNLRESKVELEKTATFLKDNNSLSLLFYTEFYSYMINNLQSPHDHEKERDLLKQINELGNLYLYFVFGHINLMTNYILGNFEEAEKWYNFAEPYIHASVGFFHLVDYCMFKSLVLIKKYENVPCEDKDEIMEILISNLAALKKWSDNCPANFAHKYYIVAAEIERIKNSSIEVILDLYKKSLASIKHGEFINVRAVINEIIAEFWFFRNDETVGSAYIKEAYYFYGQWGALAKIHLLNTKYSYYFKTATDDQKVYTSQVLSKHQTQSNSYHTSNIINLDLMSILKASHALSSEIKLDNLLVVLMETVIENAGAQNGYILLKNIFDENFYIEAIKYRDDNEIKILNSIPIIDNSKFCLEILQSVIQTKNFIILGDATNNQHYKYNEYIKNMNVKSVLCAPILYQNDLKGIIYLENNLTEDVFSVKKLEIINMLSSQIAISIEKAQLSQALQTIKESQSQLVQAEKMASLGNLVVGVAHEINTPIGVSLTAVTHIMGITEDIIKSYNNDTISKFALEEYLNDSMETIELLYMNLEKAASLIKGFKRVSADMSTEDIRTFDLKKYIEDILISLSPKLKKYRHTIKLSCEENIIISSYPGIYSQIITNLIINSLMHGYEENDEGTIEITVLRSDDNIKLIYKDDGRGMDEQTKSKIFEPFFTTNRQSGTGLGMHIVFNLVTQTLKGNIKCISTPNEGVEFIMELSISYQAELCELNLSQQAELCMDKFTNV